MITLYKSKLLQWFNNTINLLHKAFQLYADESILVQEQYQNYSTVYICDLTYKIDTQFHLHKTKPEDSLHLLRYSDIMRFTNQGRHSLDQYSNDR